MSKETVKALIWKDEYYRNGLQHLAGTNVLIKNLRLHKTHAVADIVLCTDAEAGTSERYNNCIYSYKGLGLA